MSVVELTDQEDEMLTMILKIYYNIMEVHRWADKSDPKFYVEDENDFFHLVEKLRVLTGRELEYL